jgi:hypothetical protein
MPSNFPILSDLGLSEFGVSAILAAIIWTLVWKGIALWKAARKGCIVWYLIILLINTLGILEILYIFVFARQEGECGTPVCSK